LQSRASRLSRFRPTSVLTSTLSELNEENLDNLLAIVDTWIEDVRAESGESKTGNGS
jgi:hypothetical protein